MPREISDIKAFIEICRRKDAASVRVKKNRVTNSTKFKVRCRTNLYTLIVKDSDKAEKLRQSLPPTLKLSETPKKNAKGKHVEKSSS